MMTMKKWTWTRLAASTRLEPCPFLWARARVPLCQPPFRGGGGFTRSVHLSFSVRPLNCGAGHRPFLGLEKVHLWGAFEPPPPPVLESHPPGGCPPSVQSGGTCAPTDQHKPNTIPVQCLSSLRGIQLVQMGAPQQVLRGLMLPQTQPPQERQGLCHVPLAVQLLGPIKQHFVLV